jgi:D-lactate dehydrogenase
MRDDVNSTLDLPGRRHDVLERLAHSHDASHYLLVPALVRDVTSVDEVGGLMADAVARGRSITFRSGGTSLSGQAQSDSVLVDTRRQFRSVEVLDGGARVRVGPGVTVRQVNARLAPLGFRLGPDPASEAAATVGGVIANNSSGMLCGTQFNTYRTLESVVVVLASGTVVDTGAGDADYQLRSLEPALYEGLLRLRDRVRWCGAFRVVPLTMMPRLIKHTVRRKPSQTR